MSQEKNYLELHLGDTKKYYRMTEYDAERYIHRIKKTSDKYIDIEYFDFLTESYQNDTVRVDKIHSFRPVLLEARLTIDGDNIDEELDDDDGIPNIYGEE